LQNANFIARRKWADIDDWCPARIQQAGMADFCWRNLSDWLQGLFNLAHEWWYDPPPVMVMENM